MNKRWMRIRREITKRFFFLTKEVRNQSVELVIKQDRVESLRGYQEVRLGRR